MFINKEKSRKAKIDKLVLRQRIELLVASNSIRTKNLISLETSRLKSKLLKKVLIELDLVSKIKHKNSKYRERYYISDHLEEIIYNEITNSK